MNKKSKLHKQRNRETCVSINRGYKKVHDERKRKQKREKERKRERRRDKNDLEFVPVGVIPVTGQT